MISPQAFYDRLEQAGVNFVTGVPDSLLKDFCTFADAALPVDRHIIAANEGGAVALAAGTYLATQGISLVYLQNSGLGNTVNPLLSLADSEVYGIPMILLIGWRGEPNVHDEPQHVKQGRVTPAMLDTMEIPYQILDGDTEKAALSADWAVAETRRRSAPVALLVRKGAFGKPEKKKTSIARSGLSLSREEAIGIVTANAPATARFFATTGHISRELYEQRKSLGQNRSNDFLTVGSMGHCSQLALAYALRKPEHPVICLDGDGAALMHLGGFATIGTSKATNLLHIVVNNGVHGSVGGQPTVGMEISLTGVAKACGYKQIIGPVTTAEEITSTIKELTGKGGPNFLEIHVNLAVRDDLGRPKETPRENVTLFLED
jgi:phosphonopyruvate decarboxylase